MTTAQDVVRLYREEIESGNTRPNKAVAERLGVNRRTVETYVYQARQLGMLPATVRGAAVPPPLRLTHDQLVDMVTEAMRDADGAVRVIVTCDGEPISDWYRDRAQLFLSHYLRQERHADDAG